jgi:haloalkane dehalogenase
MPTTAAGPSAAFPFVPHFVAVYGHRMHYLDEGSGDPILFLHGNPSWTYGWRNIVPLVSPNARVVAPDMIGMGRSDKPDLPYDYFLHLDYLQRFIDTLELERFVLAGHDWGSALGLSIAIRHPDRIRAFVLMETFTITNALPPEYQDAPAPWSEEVTAWCMRFIDPVEGPRLVLEEDRFNDPVLQLLTKRRLGPDEIRGYKSAYPDAASRRAQLRWPFQVLGPPDQISVNLEEFARHLPFVEQSPAPKLVIHASHGMLTPANVRWFVDRVPNVETVDIGDGYHYVQEENPGAIGHAVARWMRELREP